MSLELSSKKLLPLFNGSTCSARISIYFVSLANGNADSCKPNTTRQVQQNKRKIVKKFFLLATTGSICKFPQAKEEELYE